MKPSALANPSSAAAARLRPPLDGPAPGPHCARAGLSLEDPFLELPCDLAGSYTQKNIFAACRSSVTSTPVIETMSSRGSLSQRWIIAESSAWIRLPTRAARLPSVPRRLPCDVFPATGPSGQKVMISS